jgi:cytoskeletal protein CcmA (bactofilin family)
MSDFDPKKVDNVGQKSCAYFGEGVVFKGSINAPEKIIVHGSIEGEVVARDLEVGPNGMIKGKVSVDQADIQGKVFEQIEAKICLSLRKTGRIEGSASYGEIEIEKGGVLSGKVSTIKSEPNKQTQLPNVQPNSPLPPHVVSSNTRSSSSDKTKLEVDKMSAAGGRGGQKPQLLDPENKE